LRPIYRLYIDESGDHTYGKKEVIGTAYHYPQLEKDDKRYLSLTGCIFKLDYYRTAFIPTIEAFKRDFFDPDEQLILHAKDIIQRRGHFHILRNKETASRFDSGIIDLVANADYTVINVVIDKKNHIENYRTSAWHPYHYCLANILSRYCLFLQKNKTKGDIIAESRGKTEDFALKKVYSTIYDTGTRFKSSIFFQQYLTSNEIKLKPKDKNVAGLQLADILAHPLKKYTLQQKGLLQKPDESLFWLKVIGAVKAKLDCRSSDGCVDGYGLVLI
jgi:hypothetical protein